MKGLDGARRFLIQSYMGNRDVWAYLFALGAVGFSWPFLGIFDTSLPYYLFGIWAVLIFVVAMVASRREDEP